MLHVPSARLSSALRVAARGTSAALAGAVLLSSVAHAELRDSNYPTINVAPSVGSYVESGVASTYGEGDGFQGNLTACGQEFDTNVVQVAHKSLPCGTMLRVEDQDTGLSVVARVTDRGPYIKGRVVDLSWAAFKQLHPDGPDLLNVSIYRMP